MVTDFLLEEDILSSETPLNKEIKYRKGEVIRWPL